MTELITEEQAARTLQISVSELRGRIEVLGIMVIPAQTLGKRLAGLITQAGLERLWQEKIRRS